MLNIKIHAIPHAQQRYPTVGDYTTSEDGTWEIRVSAMSDWRREFLVALHEMIECAWAKAHNVSEAQIDAFDMAYEDARPKGDVSEPGDDPRCPVFNGHQFATGVEKLMAAHLGVNWDEYDREVNDL